MNLSRAANIVREGILGKKCVPFSGSFTKDCREHSVPQLLVMLITMIMYGANINDKTSYLSQPALSLSQLIMCNICVPRRHQPSSHTRHSEQRETPLPLFLGALVHSRIRSKDLVDTLYRLGLSVSYDRVLGLSADLGNTAISHFETIGTVCPPKVNISVFTTSPVDNIDHHVQQQQAQSDPFMEQAYYFSSTPTLKIVAQIKEALILPRGRARK